MPMFACFRRTVGALAAAAVLAAAQPAAAVSVLTIPPEKMTPVNSHLAQMRVTAYVSSLGATAATFWAPVKLPLGARIKGLVYYHWGDGTNPSSVWVTRAKIGSPLSAADIIFANTSTAAASASDPPVTLTMLTKNSPASDTLVRPGYRYFIFVSTATSGAKVAGVKILYQ